MQPSRLSKWSTCYSNSPTASNVKHQHRERRLALQALCCLDAQGQEAMESAGEFITDSRESAPITSAALTMMRKAWAERENTDKLLTQHARHWDLKRLAMVDRNILRLAVCEILSGKTPPKVVISEALRLAEEFSTAKSPKFVNGILDAVYHQIRDETKNSRDEGDKGDENIGKTEDFNRL